jgi:hypothetical protein
MMTYTDHNNLVWTRSEDRLSITCEDGRQVLGNAEMTDEYLVSVAYLPAAETKSPEERIAELEQIIQQLINK